VTADALYLWFARPVCGMPIFATRVGLGVTLLAMHLQTAPHFRALLSPAGVGGYETLQRAPGYDGLGFQAFAQFRLLHHFDSPGLISALFALLLLCAACFAAGFLARPAGVVAAALHIVFNAHNPHLDTGAAWLVGPFVLYLTWCDCGGALSVDAWLRSRRGGAPRWNVAPWGTRALQVHVCCMYLVAGFGRFDAEGWRNGDMLLRMLLDASYGRWDLDWFAMAPVLTVLGYIVLILEPAAVVLLWLRPIGRYWALMLMAMHLGIEIVVDAGWWQLLMVSALFTFLPARWLTRKTAPAPAVAVS